MSGEIWRVVPSQPQFLVSSEGRVMVMPYQSPMPNGGEKHIEGRPYFGVWNKADARFIIINKGKTYKVSQLVCEAFNGPKTESNNYCLHIDENSANNRASNLKWGSQKENLNAPAFIKYCQERVGEDSPWSRGRKKASLDELD